MALRQASARVRENLEIDMGVFLIADGDHLEYIPWCELGDQGGISLLRYFTEATTPGTIDSSDLLSALDGTFSSLYKLLLVNQAIFRGSTLQRIHPSLSQREHTEVSAGPGTVVGHPLPTQTCGLITKQTVVGGREGRGRMYVPFASEDESDVDTLLGVAPAGTYMTKLRNLADAVKATVSLTIGGVSMNFHPEVYHRAVPFNSHLISGTAARQKWATHRSRGSFGKPGPFYPF